MPDPGQRQGLSAGELRRKSIHMAVGLGAFAVVFLGPAYSALLAFAALIFNAFLWPRLGGRGVWREQDLRRGGAVGIVLYPLVVLALILIFRRRLEVAAAAWAILAFGDGMATIAGRALGGARLPWNPEKSWVGTLAFWVFGALGATAPHADIYLAAFTGAFAAALSDTMSSEIGQLSGRRTVLITTWAPVPPGIDGGVSLTGTLAGLAGALLVAVLGWAVGFYAVPGIAFVTLAGLLGTLADSVAGATLERRGLLDNHAVNLLNTLVGALAAAGLTMEVLCA